MPDIEKALDNLEVVRNWLNEAPIDELEAVEKALERNAPIHEIGAAIAEVWKLTQGYSTRTPLSEDKAAEVFQSHQRSEFYTFIMPNGDAVVGAYPQDELYFSLI